MVVVGVEVVVVVGVGVAVAVKEFSYSQLSDFLVCEAKWNYKYPRGFRPRRQGRGLSLGTLMHRLIDAWWRGEEDLGVIVDSFVAEYQDRVDPTILLAVVDDATWLADRYYRHYAKDRGRYEIVASELELHVPLPKPPGDYFGHPWPDYGLHMVVDQIVREPDLGSLVLVERKTMSSWINERLLELDAQLSTYLWGAREAGWDVSFGLYDAIRTYRWVKTDRPTHESFRRILVDRSQAESRQFALDVYRACLAADQAEHRGWVLRNVGRGCEQCDFLAPCLEAMRGSAESEAAVLSESYTTREEREALK